MPSDKTKLYPIAFLISFLTILVFLPALQNDFVNWDDNIYVTENLYIRSLDSRFFEWMFSLQDTLWVPLTRLSHALNYAIWELNPVGHHLTNNVLHGLNSFLVVMVIFRLMTLIKDRNAHSEPAGEVYVKRALITAGLTGILFGIHPLRVESVAWVTERKDVLSAFFLLLSLLYYFRFVTSSLKNIRCLNYVLSLFFFVTALLSKPIVVTLPLVLIILDIYPLERLRVGLKSQLGVLAEKIPFFALSLMSSIVIMLTYEHQGIVVTKSNVFLFERLLVSIKSICFYLYKMAWPVDLAPFYPYPSEISITTLEYFGPLILVMGITAFCIYSWKGQKVWSVVWAYFIVTLLPVLGIVKFSVFAGADRYTYLPAIGPFFLVGLGAGLIYERIVSDAGVAISIKKFLPVPAIIIICILSLMTVKQIGIWKNSFSLWNWQLTLYSTEVAYNNLGQTLDEAGRTDEAMELYKKALTLNPDFPHALYNLGNAYKDKGDLIAAEKAWQRTVEIEPGHSYALNHLGNVYYYRGLYQEAKKYYAASVEMDSMHAKAHYNLAFTLEKLNDPSGAIRHYKLFIKTATSEHHDLILEVRKRISMLSFRP